MCSFDLDNEQLFLTLYGTGWRFGKGITGVTAQIDGVDTEVTYAGNQLGYVGLDQVNLRLPRSFIGRGEVAIKLLIHGRRLNPVTVRFK